MRLDGIHHVTAITGDRGRCVSFYASVLGLTALPSVPDRADPDRCPLRFGDTAGTPGSVISFIVVPGIHTGRPGAGTIHRVAWRVAGVDALAFWFDRLRATGVEVEPLDAAGAGAALRFRDPEGLGHALVPDVSGDEPLDAHSAAVPTVHRLRGLDGVRAYSRAPGPSADLLAGRLGFTAVGEDAYGVEGPARRAEYRHEEPPPKRALPGAGTFHHVAWTCEPAEQPAWRQRVIGLGARVTPILDRGSTRSFYFREPSGVLFEIATRERVPGIGPLSADRHAPPTTELPIPAAA
jgi:glyoxalase family protein